MLTFGPSTAVAAGCAVDASVVVHVVGDIADGQTRTLSADDIEDSVTQTAMTYEVRTSTGAPTSDVGVPAALSIRGLVALLGIPGLAPENVTFAEIPHPQIANYVSTLQGADLAEADQAGFQHDLVPVVYVVGCNDSVGYIRPLRGDDDVNGQDNFQSYSGGRLDLTLHTSGRLLTPTITASATEVKVGDPVTFQASVDAPPGATYDWSFGDGHGSALAPTHAWSTAGTYLVNLTVTGADSSAGRSNTLRVVVDAADPVEPTDPGDPTQSPGGNGGQHNPTTGPDQGDGHVTDTTPSPASAPSAETGSQDASDDPGAAPTAAPPVPGDQQQAGQADGELTGILLAGAEVPAAESGEPATAPAARAGTDDHALRLPWWLALIGVGIGLLGIGALSESRWARRFRSSGPA